MQISSDARFDCDVLLPALVDTVKKYHIPTEYLFAVLDGVEMDLDRRRYETFEELQIVLPARGLGRGIGVHSYLGISRSRNAGRRRRL